MGFLIGQLIDHPFDCSSRPFQLTYAHRDPGFLDLKIHAHLIDKYGKQSTKRKVLPPPIETEQLKPHPAATTQTSLSFVPERSKRHQGSVTPQSLPATIPTHLTKYKPWFYPNQKD
jgi:hypothetical protein